MKKAFFLFITLSILSCSGNQNKADKTTTEQGKSPTIETNKAAKPNTEKKANAKMVPETEMIAFEGGTFLMGSNDGLPQEKPAHKATVKAFSIDKTPVTVAQFRIFIETTGHKTEAESYGDSGVYDFEAKNWTLLPGAFWQKPFGPNGPQAQDNHPVTHISWNDAVAFAKWAGKRLPTEAEWEYAARSGKNSNEKFSWGNEISVNGKYFANTWQGTLDKPETGDGFLFTSPVGTFGENEAVFAILVVKERTTTNCFYICIFANRSCTSRVGFVIIRTPLPHISSHIC